MTERSGIMLRSLSLSSESFTERRTRRNAIAQNLESRVDSAAPATPMPKPKIKIELPIIFIMFITSDEIIEMRLFPIERNSAAAAL